MRPCRTKTVVSFHKKFLLRGKLYLSGKNSFICHDKYLSQVKVIKIFYSSAKWKLFHPEAAGFKKNIRHNLNVICKCSFETIFCNI